MRRSMARHQAMADVALALVFIVVGLVELVVPVDDRYGTGPMWLDVLLVLTTSVPLAFRRRYPVAVAVAAFGPHLVVSLITSHTATFWGTLLPLTVALYSCARYGPAPIRRALPVLALPAAFCLAYGLHVPDFGSGEDYAFTGMVFGAAWGAGRIINHLQQQRRALREALAVLAAQTEHRRRQVVFEERTRIAREMHDVVAHGVSVMVVQAGSARLELGAGDDAARDSLLAVEDTGRRVLDELRRTVFLLRSGDETSDGRPTPGLSDIPVLVDAMRAAGLDIDLTMDVDTVDDPGRALAAYRVVQEALTNVLRHAGSTAVRVRVTGGPDLSVEVFDDGSALEGSLQTSGAATPSLEGSGHGLVGMRERVEMYGGRLSIERGGRVFAVRAEIPANTP